MMQRTVNARQAARMARHYYRAGMEARKRRLSNPRSSGQEYNFYAGMYFAHVNLARVLTGRKPYSFGEETDEGKGEEGEERA